mmetsp:Transcript_17755/g.37117  ORF Transcript_17755/g.37117 Transcript_17755/m.37117 type:complete len:277 (+) Transcript_17755:174-1004(+)
MKTTKMMTVMHQSLQRKHSLQQVQQLQLQLLRNYRAGSCCLMSSLSSPVESASNINSNDNGNTNTNTNTTRNDGSAGDEQASQTQDPGRAPSNDNDDNNDDNPSSAENANTNNSRPKSPPAARRSPAGNKFTALQNLLGKNRIATRLCGSPTKEHRAVWKLEPCTPRAVSSEKLKTFAIGTSIAVGTTIAMPFALAGVAAVMGAVGAEAGIGFGIVAAGLTGAEALASVGAIGAISYVCFRPARNSLTDDHQAAGGGNEETETPWSKRPFSNWRNW